jgi:YHS domain-containing protein
MKLLQLSLLAFFFISFITQAQDLKPYYNVDKAGVWVDGYDPVAYFTDGKALKGNPAFAVTYKGAKFYTISKAHQDLFKKEPEKYLPQYGGYCAYALGSYNEKVEVDPETFSVKDGKVFLFYNKFFNNTLKDWNNDETKLHQKADKNWSVFKHQ